MAIRPYTGSATSDGNGGTEFRPPIAADQFPPAPPTPPSSLPTLSYVGGQVLAGLIEGALAGQMGQQSLRALKYQIDEALASYDAGVRPGPYQIGTLAFSNAYGLSSQVARLRSASTQLAGMIV